MHGARGALADPAAVLGADEAERIAEHPQHRRIGGDVHGVGLSVHAQRVLAHPCAPEAVRRAPFYVEFGEGAIKREHEHGARSRFEPEIELVLELESSSRSSTYSSWRRLRAPCSCSALLH